MDNVLPPTRPLWLHSFGTLALSVALLSGCVVAPKPLSLGDAKAQAQQDLKSMFAEQEPVNGPLTLEEAMARAIKYNLEHRTQMMEQALAVGQTELSRYDMLPRVTAQAGYVGRTNTQASSSESIETRSQSLEPSTSVDNDRRVAELSMVWNVLDFGVSYVSAQQQADRVLIAEERRRKVVNNIIQQVRSAYWRAVAADRLLTRIDPLMSRVQKALEDNAAIERLKISAPTEALNYRRSLLDTLRRLEQQRKDLMLAKTELGALISLPFHQEITLAVQADYSLPTFSIDDPLMTQLEGMALARRPELQEARYQKRISADETRKTMLRMLPGLEFHTAANYDSNSYLENNRWADYGARITWNLMNSLSGPAHLRYAKASEQLLEAQRQALSMAVLAQLHVARANYQEALRSYKTSEEIYQIDQRLNEQMQASAAGQRVGELAVIQGELNAVQSALQRDLSYAELNNALGQIYVSAGMDPLPESVPDDNVQALASALGQVMQSWNRGAFK